MTAVERQRLQTFADSLRQKIQQEKESADHFDGLGNASLAFQHTRHQWSLESCDDFLRDMIDGRKPFSESVNLDS